MPRIDPLSLLKCLSVLLGSTGGIKSKEEVHRLANLMTKFSKKLVSKCIYIQILKTTDTELLSQFMGAGGWNLVHMWLTDGILAKNWALIQELLELLLLCPVDIERLKSNNCPKLIKGLSKEGSHQGVRILASRLVEQWLKIVKGEAAPNSVPAQIVTLSSSIKSSTIPTAIVNPRPSISTTQSSSCSSNNSNSSNSNINVIEKNETDRNTQLVQNNCNMIETTTTTTTTTTATQENQQIEPSNDCHRISERTLLHTDSKQQCPQQKKQSFVVVPSSQTGLVVPVYKITIRDGKQVLTKVETDSSNITNVINISSSEINGDHDTIEFQNNPKFDDYHEEEEEEEEEEEKVENQVDKCTIKEVVSELPTNDNETANIDSKKANCETSDDVDNKIKNNKDIKQSSAAISSENNKSANDKENRDFSKKDNDKKLYTNNNNNNCSSSSSSSIIASSATGDKSNSEKKISHHSSSSSKSSSKHSSSHRSSSHRSSSSSSSSHRSNSKTSKTKEKHHSSSNSSSSNSSNTSSSKQHGSNSKSRSERDKEKQEREKEKQKKDQAEKDKATLEKVQGPALTSKLGKIPKKKIGDEPNEITTKRSSTDSKETTTTTTTTTKKILSNEKKNISISIENRKIQDSTRPKTVKTFNSKFRSTGLEEEAKLPPPRSARKPNIVADKPKILSSKISSLKRPSPLRESSSSSSSTDKKARLLLDNSIPPSSDEKKGGIKLIKPKRENYTNGV